MEELLSFFDNVLVLRANYPVSSDLDPRGLLGKLARFEKVKRVAPAVTVLQDLVPLIPEMVSRWTTGPVNFVNEGGAPYAEIVDACKACVEHYASVCTRAPLGRRSHAALGLPGISISLASGGRC